MGRIDKLAKGLHAAPKPQTTPSKRERNSTDWKKFEIRITDNIPPPVAVLRYNGEVVCSQGNISTVVGAPKSRKTFLCAAMAAGYISEKGFLGFDAPTNGRLLYCDTEQSESHVYRVLKRIYRCANLSTDTANPTLKMLVLRELDPAERFETIQQAIIDFNPTMVIIDGVADLQRNTNDLEESEQIVSELMRISSQRKCHIIGILHTNPNSDKARGHSGSVLQRRSESVFLTKLSDDRTTVTPQYCRNPPFAEFAFMVNADGLPELSTMPTPTNVLSDVMTPNKTYVHKELQELLESHLELKPDAAKKRIQRAVREGYIVKNDVGSYHLPMRMAVQTNFYETEADDEKAPY